MKTVTFLFLCLCYLGGYAQPDEDVFIVEDSLVLKQSKHKEIYENGCIVYAGEAYPKSFDSPYGEYFWRVHIYKYVHERMQPSDTTEGTIFFQFRIDTLGNVDSVEILKGLTNELNQLVIDGLKDLGDWCPAYKATHKTSFGWIFPIPISYKKYIKRKED
jgi:hypothetical protein